MIDYSLNVTNLHKRFLPLQSPTIRNLLSLGNQKKFIIACDNINLKVERGQLLGVMGPNGSGKTTLIRILAGIILPDSGTAKVKGFDIINDGIKARASVGVVLGDTRNFYVRLTGRDNLKLFAAFYNVPTEGLDKRIEELASLFGIYQHLDKMFQENSTGIKQRFGLARSLLSDAPILLLDEPTKHLDPLMASELRKFIKDDLTKKKGKTVLFTSHSFSEVADIADKIAILDQGKIKALGTLEELSKKSGGNISDLSDIYNFYTNSQ